jgi:glycosyltransferase involved in cell wall biosynthesis
VTIICETQREVTTGGQPEPRTWNTLGPAVHDHAQAAINVLYVIDQLSALGGGERAMIRMIRAHSPRFNPQVLTFREDIHPEAKQQLAVPIHVIPLVQTGSIEGLRAALSIRALILSERIHIVHTFFETSDLFAGFVAKLAGVKVLISSRRDMGILRSRKHQIAYRIVGRLCSKVLTVSEAVRKQVLGKDRLDPERVTTLYTGIHFPHPQSIESIPDVRRRIGIPHGVPIVLTVAHILPWKRHADFLRMAARLHEKFLEAQFVVAGSANDRALFMELLSLRESLGLRDHVHFLGEVDFVNSLYRAASVFCLLSESEGLPNVVLEAMAAGVPVVATNAGGTTEVVVDGQTGYLTEVGCPEEAAERVDQLLRSPELRRNMSMVARTRVESLFSIERMMSTLERIYESSVCAR